MLVQLKALKTAGLAVLAVRTEFEILARAGRPRLHYREGRDQYRGAGEALRTDAELRHKCLMV